MTMKRFDALFAALPKNQKMPAMLGMLTLCSLPFTAYGMWRK
jgi:hypothetical protein